MNFIDIDINEHTYIYTYEQLLIKLCYSVNRKGYMPQIR